MTMARITIANAPQNGSLVQWLMPQAASVATDSAITAGNGAKRKYLNFICTCASETTCKPNEKVSDGWPSSNSQIAKSVAGQPFAPLSRSAFVHFQSLTK